MLFSNIFQVALLGCDLINICSSARSNHDAPASNNGLYIFKFFPKKKLYPKNFGGASSNDTTPLDQGSGFVSCDFQKYCY